MQAASRRIIDIINQNRQFIIPVFQRDYTWGVEQCRQMWDDVTRVGQEDDGEHFFGSVVYTEGKRAPSFTYSILIDGQQRLTTMTLLLVALRDHIRGSHWKGELEDSPTVTKIDALFLKNAQEIGDRHYKLALRRHDHTTLTALVDGQALSEITGGSDLIIAAYEYFKDMLSGVSPDIVYWGIGRLSIVDVLLEPPADNPQLVFESLNSTGVDLTETDLIRNYLLMSLPEPEQTTLYNEHWRKLETYFRAAGDAPDIFLRDYMALKRGLTTPTRLDRIYSEFKLWQRPSELGSVDALLADIVRFGRFYVDFLSSNRITSPALASAMRGVRSLGTAQAILIMRLYDCYERNLLTETDFIKSLILVESYLLRRAVLGLQTRNYWSVFASIASFISDENPFQSLQVAFARQHLSFPSDEAFNSGIQECDLYPLRVCSHILERLENTGYNTQSPTQDYSIEHIMPQSTDKVLEWQAMLGDDWADVHATWLHRLGNLTLVGWRDNPMYSNKPFEEKQSLPGGFRQSAVRLNEYVRGQIAWTASEMEARGQLLADRACQIWPPLKADRQAIREAVIRELRDSARIRSSDDLVMPDHVRSLLGSCLSAIRGLDNVIEVVENRSVCCYSSSAGFLAELLPFTGYIRLFVPLAFDELGNPDGWQDTTWYKFLRHVVHRDCGAFIDIYEEQQIPTAILAIRQVLRTTED